MVRLLMGGQQGSRHTLAEFTREDIEARQEPARVDSRPGQYGLGRCDR